MKCPLCGAWSSVLQTNGVRRRRECANNHRFNTIEQVVESFADRDARILNDTRTAPAIGRDLGISAERVYQIRLGGSQKLKEK